MPSSDEQMAIRDEACRKIMEAFGNTEIGARHDRSPLLDQSAVFAYLNLGNKRQRTALVTVLDEGVVKLHLSDIHLIPDGLTTSEVTDGMTLPVLATLRVDTPDLGGEVLRWVRETAVA